MQNNLIEHFLFAFFFFLGFLITSYISKIKGFLTLPLKRFTGTCCHGIDVVVNIIFFIICFSFLGPVFYSAIPFEGNSKLYQLTIIPIISLAFNILLIIVYTLLKKTFPAMHLIKDTRFPGKLSLTQDIISGWKTLLLSFFPLFAVMLFVEAIGIWINGETAILQDAVKFLIKAKEQLGTLLLALFTIIITAPTIEEFIFRGTIQSYFRKKCGSIASIFIASLFFSLFHFSPSQGLQNIPILISLFILSLYLGFIYEKTRSLISSITLHVTFNLISAIKIIFYSV